MLMLQDQIVDYFVSLIDNCENSFYLVSSDRLRSYIFHKQFCGVQFEVLDNIICDVKVQ